MAHARKGFRVLWAVSMATSWSSLWILGHCSAPLHSGPGSTLSITGEDNSEGVSLLELPAYHRLSIIFSVYSVRKTRSWWWGGVRTQDMSTKGNIHINKGKHNNEQSSIELRNINMLQSCLYHSHEITITYNNICFFKVTLQWITLGKKTYNINKIRI